MQESLQLFPHCKAQSVLQVFEHPPLQFPVHPVQTSVQASEQPPEQLPEQPEPQVDLQVPTQRPEQELLQFVVLPVMEYPSACVSSVLIVFSGGIFCPLETVDNPVFTIAFIGVMILFQCSGRIFPPAVGVTV